MVVTCPERGPASRRHKNGLRRLPAPPAIVNRVRNPGGGWSAPPPHRLGVVPPRAGCGRRRQSSTACELLVEDVPLRRRIGWIACRRHRRGSVPLCGGER